MFFESVCSWTALLQARMRLLCGDALKKPRSYSAKSKSSWLSLTPKMRVTMYLSIKLEFLMVSSMEMKGAIPVP